MWKNAVIAVTEISLRMAGLASATANSVATVPRLRQGAGRRREKAFKAFGAQSDTRAETGKIFLFFSLVTH
jgi:hypothetical protein